MPSLCTHYIARTSGLLSLALAAGGAQAAVTTYTASADFLAATTTTNLATFEGIATGSRGSALTVNGITITSLPGGSSQHDVFIAPAGNVYFNVPNTSAALTANGDENFKIQLAAAGTFTSIGFDFYSNPYGAPTFALYDSGGALIASVAVPQAISTLGFIGFASTTPVAYITTTVDQGWRVNTGFDNLRLGSANAVPEPHAAWLMLAGLAAMTSLARRQRG
jgi:hypothetical protein